MQDALLGGLIILTLSSAAAWIVITWLSNLWQKRRTFDLGTVIIRDIKLGSSTVTVLTIGDGTLDEYTVFTTSPRARLFKVGTRLTDVVARGNHRDNPAWGGQELVEFTPPLEARELKPRAPNLSTLSDTWVVSRVALVETAPWGDDVSVLTLRLGDDIIPAYSTMPKIEELKSGIVLTRVVLHQEKTNLKLGAWELIGYDR